MSRTGRQNKRVKSLVWIAIFGILLLAGTLARVWALPGRVALGQTIPPPPTATPTSTISVQPTATWTPLPTWTQVPTQPPEPPTPTATPGVSLPTSQPPMPTETNTPFKATVTAGVTASPSATPTALAILRTPTAALPTTPSPQPIPLAFEVTALQQVAGPRDAVQFILRVANVGYGPVDGVQINVVFPDDLQLQFVECARCTTDCPQCTGGLQPGRLNIFIGLLASGDQVIAPVHVAVADDAWPGQTQRTEWTLIAVGLPAQTAQTELVLPWAQLPATGGR